MDPWWRRVSLTMRQSKPRSLSDDRVLSSCGGFCHGDEGGAVVDGEGT